MGVDIFQHLLEQVAVSDNGTGEHVVENEFLRIDNHYRIGALTPPPKPQKTLPPGVYSLTADPFGFKLEIGDPFAKPKKLYGDTDKLVARMLATYMDRNRNTGIMLSGEKGSGKSLTAKLLSVACLEAGIPTIIVNHPFCGEGFNQFLGSITQRCMVLFDEFEKVYDRDDQKKLLTLLDGTSPSNKLFVFTSNEYSELDYHLKNRPGRIFYGVKYSGLDAQFMREYLQDTLKNQEHLEKTLRVCNLLGRVNFDTLQALVEEMNRYGEDPREALRLLNLEIEKAVQYYGVTLEVDGQKIRSAYPYHVRSPLASGDDDDDEEGVRMVIQDRAADDEVTGRFSEYIFGAEHFAGIDEQEVITFRDTEKKAVLTLKPRKNKKLNLDYVANAYL